LGGRAGPVEGGGAVTQTMARTQPLPQPQPTAYEPDPTAAPTLALALLTLAAAVAMGRLFDSWDFLVPFAVTALWAHWLAWFSRRIGLSLATSIPLTLAGSALAAVWVLFPHTTVYGLPLGETWRTASEALDEAWRAFATVVAPAPTAKGFLLAGVLGIAVAAILADWAAFRIRAAFESAIPSFALFLFTAVLGSAQYRSQSVVAYLVTLMAFVLVHQASMASESASWFASRSRGGVGALLQGGFVLGAIAVVAALGLGPNLPGSSAEPVLDWREEDDGGPSRRTTISPLVDIRGRLVEQSSTEVFTVKANQPAYWRLTSLDTFDGSIWQSDDSYKPTDESLPGGVAVRARADEVVQEFTIGSLSSIWLPAAFRPVRIDGIDKVSFNRDTGSLITRADTTNGLRYKVQSAVARPTVEELQQVASLDEADVERYLDLPPISTDVQRLARRLTAGQGTPYAKAKAIQDFFHRDFAYDLQARPGHSGRALDRFLFETRRGYCEQFAGAYGVLARLAGLPARVAVGFTQGELGPDGAYHVRGLNAHAWPEVYVEGYGWVYFEATPGRGMPGAEGWTGLPAQQADAANPTTATTGTTAAPAPPEAEPPPAEGPSADDTVATDPGDDTPLLGHGSVRAGLALVVAAAAWATGVPTLRRSQRRRRRAAASGDGRDRVLVAWREAVEAMGEAGVPRRPSETADEYSRRAPAAAQLSLPAATALHDLARDMAPACYAEGPLSPEVVQRSVRNAAVVEKAVRERATLWDKLRWELDPRPLWPSGTRRRVVNRARARARRAA
jgi:transglutaminase-like putative cysteine protease